MNCTRCNIELKFDDRECPGCGTSVLDIIKEIKLKEELTKLSQIDMNDINIGNGNVQTRTETTYVNNDNVMYTGIQHKYQTAEGTSNYYSVDMPMKWYKFLIYFWLFFEVARCIFTSYLFLTGKYLDFLYYENINDLYLSYPNMRTLDIVFGILLISYAVFCFYTRQKLAKYSRIAPILASHIFLILPLLEISYFWFTSKILGIDLSEFLNRKFYVTLFFSILNVLLHRKYFSKRLHLFRN